VFIRRTDASAVGDFSNNYFSGTLISSHGGQVRTNNNCFTGSSVRRSECDVLDQCPDQVHWIPVADPSAGVCMELASLRNVWFTLVGTGAVQSWRASRRLPQLLCSQAYVLDAQLRLFCYNCLAHGEHSIHSKAICFTPQCMLCV
jgi:hypothetical protein